MLSGSYDLFKDTLGQWLSVGSRGYIPQGEGVSESGRCGIWKDTLNIIIEYF